MRAIGNAFCVYLPEHASKTFVNTMPKHVAEIYVKDKDSAHRLEGMMRIMHAFIVAPVSHYKMIGNFREEMDNEEVFRICLKILANPAMELAFCEDLNSLYKAHSLEIIAHN